MFLQGVTGIECTEFESFIKVPEYTQVYDIADTFYYYRLVFVLVSSKHL